MWVPSPLLSLVVSGGGTFSLTARPIRDSHGSILADGNGCAFSGNLSITHNAGNQTSPTNVSLSGTGGPAPPATINISISPTSIDFGSGAVGQIFEQTLTIINQEIRQERLQETWAYLPLPSRLLRKRGPSA